ncbi:hypothetical protein PV327_010891 [Microctonus hyperodae]|nr:hypothetical protein PV327_010891 [Microctonus hyperodae]
MVFWGEELSVYSIRENCGGWGLKKEKPSGKKRTQFQKRITWRKTLKLNDELIGVHCTHGLNRTGFMVCQYLVRQLGWSVSDAIKEFEIARGHTIERQPYLKALELAQSGEKIISRIHNDLIEDKNNDHRDQKSNNSRWNNDKNNTRKYYPQRDYGSYNRRNDTDRKSRNSRMNNDRELSKNWRNNQSNFSPSTTSSSTLPPPPPPRGQFNYHPRPLHNNWRESSLNDHQNNSRNSHRPNQLINSIFSSTEGQSAIVNSQNSSSSITPAARFDYYSPIFYSNWRKPSFNDSQNNPKN